MKRFLTMGVILFVFASPSINFADCRGACLEMSGECNLECPMDQPAGAVCHAWCQVLQNRCVTTCADKEYAFLLEGKDLACIAECDKDWAEKKRLCDKYYEKDSEVAERMPMIGGNIFAMNSVYKVCVNFNYFILYTM